MPFWFGSQGEKDDRQFVMSFSFSLLLHVEAVCTSGFWYTQFYCHSVHEWAQALNISSGLWMWVNAEQVLVWVILLCLVRCSITDHQQSSLIPPLIPMSVLHLLSILCLHFLLPHCLYCMLCDERPIKWKKRTLPWKIKCCTTPLIFLLSKPVKQNVDPTHVETKYVSVFEKNCQCTSM